MNLYLQSSFLLQFASSSVWLMSIGWLSIVVEFLQQLAVSRFQFRLYLIKCTEFMK